MSAMYFLAIVAPPGVDEKVTEWKNFMRDHFGCQVALRSPAHITLIPPFWMEPDLQPKLQDAMHEFSARQNTFQIQLHNFDSFRPKVIFVGVNHSEALQTLANRLEEYLLGTNSFPVKKSARPFHPHMTIANRDLHKKDFYTAWELFKNRKYRENFLVDGITLLKHNGTHWIAEYKSIFPSA